MVLVDPKQMPTTHEGLKQWVVEKSKEKDYLMMTDVAKDVYEIIGGGSSANTLNRSGHLLHLQHLIHFQKNLKISTALKRQNLNLFSYLSILRC